MAGTGLTDLMLSTPVWDDALVHATGYPVHDSTLVTVGGGLGSFALAQHLLAAGLPPQELVVISEGTDPAHTYRYLADNSQMFAPERIRSDASSRIDNLWGFPSYAVREAFRGGGPGAKGLGALVNVATEPLLSEYYTPRAGDVYDGVAREAERIRWARLVHLGRCRMVRRRMGGGYFVVRNLRERDATGRQLRVVHRTRFVHLALGYPGLQFLEDLQGFRETRAGATRVVNSYEPHEHVHRALRGRHDTVLVRGSGIVASRLLQRLLDDAEAGRTGTRVVHLFRTYADTPRHDGRATRPVGDGFNLQPFNFPKSCFGGQLADEIAALDPPRRAERIKHLAGTTTAPRRAWQDQLARASAAGAYVQLVGRIEGLHEADDGAVVARVTGADGRRLEVHAAYVIDATGLVGDIGEHHVLADLFEHGGAQRNAMNRVDTLPSFEAVGTDSAGGRLYVSGAAALGGPFAPVDSFLGLQYAARCVTDDLARQQVLPRFGPGRSVAEWWRWARGRAPRSVARAESGAGAR